jgi:hypothetical protein
VSQLDTRNSEPATRRTAPGRRLPRLRPLALPRPIPACTAVPPCPPQRSRSPASRAGRTCGAPLTLTSYRARSLYIALHELAGRQPWPPVVPSFFSSNPHREAQD